MVFDGEEIKILIAKDLNLLRGIFLTGEISKILVVRKDFFPFIMFRIKIQGKSEQPIHGWCNNFFDIFGKKGDTWRMILGDKSARHGFILRDLILIGLFEISHNCVPECTLQTKFLLKLI